MPITSRSFIGAKKQRGILFLLGVILALGFFSREAAPASAACDYPAQILDLSNWKETLPTGKSGSPTEITQTSLASYSAAPYFHPNSACNGVIFRAPVNGATTSGSGYPRSELREMNNNGTQKASWSTTSGTHTMYLDQAITAVPKTKKHVVAGQIHDAEDDVIVIRLEYPRLFVDINGKSGPTLDPNYTLGKRFTVKFVASGGQIKIYYNDGPAPVYTLSKSGSGYYFKAGAYTQSNCSKESDCSAGNFGEVVIYNLSLNDQKPAPVLASTSAPEPAVANNPAPTVNGLIFEAESGTLTAPMQIATNSFASGEKYIVQTTDSGTGAMEYSIDIPESGQYQLRANVIAPNESSNSFYYAFDGGSQSTWNLPGTLTKWTWTDGPKITLTKGVHTLLIKKREKNARLDIIELKSTAITTPDSTAPATDGTIPFEAESGTIDGGMTIMNDDPSASDGKYVQADSAGSINYQFNIPLLGTYRLAGWIRTLDGSSDSLYASIDGKSASTWTLAYPTLTWTNDIHDGSSFPLSAGPHTLTLKYREAGVKIDKVVLVKQ